MTLSPGSRIGPYDIVGAIGKGGMGEVFRARDSRLKRDVALKVLPTSFASNPDRRARFEREAQVLASLNHPNIAQVFGVEETNGAPVIVMEYVEGPSLDEVLRRGHSNQRDEPRLPLSECLAIAKQLCEGLEAAHDRGIVHRDLKPANIKLRADEGTVKILDFGLAAVGRAVMGQDGAESPDSATTLSPVTQVGTVMGTAAYMSPEQARGLAVDKRADIWSFGCVLYEMLVGSSAFSGETTTDVLAAVVRNDPDWSRLPAHVPDRVSELLRRCLQKAPKNRLRDIADARFEIEQALQSPLERDIAPGAPSLVASPPSRASSTMVSRLLWATAGAVVAAALILVPRALRTPDGPPEAPVRAIIKLPPDTTLALGRGSAVILSPDGRQLVFAGRSKEKTQLYVRSLDRLESRPIAGTDDASNPFFAPDGQWVGFFAEGKLKKVLLDGGAPVSLADARTPRGEAWGGDNLILFTPANNVGLSRMSSLGGKPETFTTLSDGELSHRWPRFLPDGSTILYSVWNDTGWEPAHIVAKPLAGGEAKVIVPAGGGYPRYVRDGTSRRGYLVYARSDGILAAPFDESRLEVDGQAVPIVDSILTNLSGGAHFDVSATGTLAYAPGTIGEADRDLMWVALDGKATPALRIHDMGRYWTLSADRTRIARANTAGPNRDIWIEHLTSGVSTRLTQSNDNYQPLWSDDGQWIVFARGIPFSNIYRRATDGTDIEERLTTVDRNQGPTSASPDGTSLLYSEFDQVTGSDIWVLTLPTPPAGGNDAAVARATAITRPFIKTTFGEGNAMFSPDGKWVAYQSNESGRFEIYVMKADGSQVRQVTHTRDDP